MRSKMIGAALLCAALSAFGCDSSDDLSRRQNAVQYSQQSQCTALLAGQSINAGSVCLSVQGENLVAAYTTTGGWELTEAHLWVGDDLAAMPRTKNGNPQIGRFPYNSGDISGATSYSFSIPLSSLSSGDLCGHTFYVAAHAAVRKPDGSGGYQTETGWGAGSQITTGGSWATYFSYTVTCVTPPPPPSTLTCDTAYGYGSTTFIDLGLTKSRWGWQIGPLSPGSYTQPIYAGAGKNDISKGANVGQLSIEYDGAAAKVSYSLSAGYVLQGTHLYVGTSPVSTISPGQYGNTHDLDNVSSDSFTVGGFSGQPIYCVAHAVACR